MKLSKKWIVGICLVLLVALVLIGQCVIRSTPSPKIMGYEDAVQLLQQTGQSENEIAHVWKSKDGKLVFNATEDMKYVLESESKGIYIGDDSIHPVKVLTDNNHIQVIGEDSGIIFEGYGKYDSAEDNINVFCKSNTAKLSTYDVNGAEWVDFCLLKSV